MITSRLQNMNVKERLKCLNTDYKSTGNFWYYDDKFMNWILEIDNQFYQQQIIWINKDISNGYANLYHEYAFYQKEISKPWINNICLQLLSNDGVISYGYTSVHKINFPEYTTEVIEREQFQNIYEYMEFERNQYGFKYYDVRIETLALEYEK